MDTINIKLNKVYLIVNKENNHYNTFITYKGVVLCSFSSVNIEAIKNFISNKTKLYKYLK